MSDTAKKYTYGRDEYRCFRIRRPDGNSLVASARGIDGSEFIVAELNRIAAQRDALLEACCDVLEAVEMVRAGKTIVLNESPDGIVETLRTAIRNCTTTSTSVTAEAEETSSQAVGRIFAAHRLTKEEYDALPANTPSVNAELLAACKKFVDGGECYCHELDANSKPCGVCAAIAAIVRAEKGGVA